jgi:hypothetical protein
MEAFMGWHVGSVHSMHSELMIGRDEVEEEGTSSGVFAFLGIVSNFRNRRMVVAFDSR